MLLLTQVCKARTSSWVYDPACWRPVCREAACFGSVCLGESGGVGVERAGGLSSMVGFLFFARFAGGLRGVFGIA